MTRRIAVVGAGIAGLAAAWLLRRSAQVTLFEAEARAGGHADTQAVAVDGRTIAVDTGFIVFNNRNYPRLNAMFAALEVPFHDSEMSFGVSVDDGRFEYGGGSLRQVFAQKRNLARPRFWGMLRDTLRFYREAPALLGSGAGISLGAWLERGGYGAGFVEDHILPMGAAIWSASPGQVRQFPAEQFVRFFHNHGLLSLRDRPQWHTVTGGSLVYVRRVLRDYAATGELRLNCPVRRLTRDAEGVTLFLDQGARRFDAVVLACHADQALALLDPPSVRERRVLGAIRCADNVAVLHGDTRLMPRRRAVWSAWNYLADGSGDADRPVTLTYWMNRLQSLPTEVPLLVTLNPARTPLQVHATRRYRHPQFDQAAIAAQRELPSIQGGGGVWYAGAWTGWGFHEDGIAAAVRVVEGMGLQPAWRATTPARVAA